MDATKPTPREERGSLGWLTESTTLPRKRKEIEGVSGRGVVDLQAQLYRAQEHSRLRRDGQVDVHDRHTRRHAGIDVAEILNHRNPGVDDRDQRDRLHVKAPGDRTKECYAALERKAQLYDKLARGEVEDDEEHYEVDFLRKESNPPFQTNEYARGLHSDNEAEEGPGHKRNDELWAEREARQGRQDEAQRAVEEEQQAAERHRQFKETIHGVAAETRDRREREAATKQRRGDSLTAKREQLKAEFLKRQLQRLKAGKGVAPEKG